MEYDDLIDMFEKQQIMIDVMWMFLNDEDKVEVMNLIIQEIRDNFE